MQQKWYRVGELCTLFAIHPATLRRWRAQLGMVPQVNPADRTQVFYTEEQVMALAIAHHRVAVLTQIQAGRVEALEVRVAALEARLGCDIVQ
ncbi:MerR family transcriptional regulator [Dictyobacter kobayashii]|uniref:HTH merR-type domain-containing protein n=1 Tax=Dictyobacter kobayashii TaxID=2014872 RepID=A0A402AEQ3_9CHLR|nr:MerR family transcriptional regulator [Dictyobacter kobayashii]GCE17566.1 hypothetical protein KDK_13660 [Dictyobacter kobayashii]